MTTEEVLTPIEWRSALPPELRTKHVHSWCPFCYLGWRPARPGRIGGGCCSIALPTGAVEVHVPAISFERESETHKIMGMFRPRPWEASQMMKAGINPNLQRREIPGLARALEIGTKVNALVGKGMDRHAAHVVVLAQYDAMAAQQVASEPA